MNDLFKKLLWLPAPPQDFTARCHALTAGPDQGTRIQHLAGHSLSSLQLNQLAKALSKARDGGATLSPLVPLRLGVLSNGTTDIIVPALMASAARYGIALECVVAAFDRGIQQALCPDSPLNEAKPDAVLLALDPRGLGLDLNLTTDEDGPARVTAAVQRIELLRTAIRQHTGAFCMIQTVAEPPETLFGSLDVAIPESMRHILRDFNTKIVNSIPGSGDVLLDIASLAATVGTAEWYSPRHWYLARLPFADAYVPLYAEHVCRTLASVLGKSRKCLVLDLDNTLWGGVIGDDGLAGIRLSIGDPVGEAHRELQRFASSLRARGILLAIASKNDEAIARTALREHPDMLLREEHVSAFRVNWGNKADSLRSIAAELAVGLDALVFCDDNPMERDLIRAELPGVAVPEMPANVALYVRTLSAAGYFEAQTFSVEDRIRADRYLERSRVAATVESTTDFRSYLESLRMELECTPFDAAGRARITQLINKSNQFNLTGRRYTAAEIQRLERHPGYVTLQARLRDKLGDHGMIVVVICRILDPDAWEIETWLMSCRVLGRCVEEAVLNALLAQARSCGTHKLIGLYQPTGRNRLVETHYANLGFTQLNCAADGRSGWVLEVNDEARRRCPIMVRQVASNERVA